MRKNVRFPSIYLTIVRAGIDNAYIIKYAYKDEHGNTTRVKCDATKMDLKGRNKPGQYSSQSKNENNSDMNKPMCSFTCTGLLE